MHRQLIVDELDVGQLVAVFKALTQHAPDALDRRRGLFRICCEIVLLSVPSAPSTEPASPGRNSGRRAPPSVPSSEQ